MVDAIDCALIALLTTYGWFVPLPAAILRLTHPRTVGKFAAGIWIDAILQIVGLVVTDGAGLAATVQNYRRSGTTIHSEARNRPEPANERLALTSRLLVLRERRANGPAVRSSSTL